MGTPLTGKFRAAMIAVYLFLGFAGITYIFDPSQPVAQVSAQYDRVPEVWSGFLIIGGLTAASAVAARKKYGHTVALIYFEMAGLALLIAAISAYSYALFESAALDDNFRTAGLGIVVFSFALSLLIRTLELHNSVIIARRYNNYINKREIGDAAGDTL